MDGSLTTASKTAEAVVAVWGADNIEKCRSHKGQPLLFLNMTAKFDGRLELNMWHDRLVVPGCSCDRTTQLKELASQDNFAKDREQLTSKQFTWDPDHAATAVTGEALLSCCAFLEMASEDPNATLPQLLQVNGMRLEEPEPGDSVLESTGQCIFFTTTACDFQ